MIRNFSAVVSLLFLLACATGKKEMTANPHREISIPAGSYETDSLYAYKTVVNAYGREITGILYIKKMEADNYRVVFSNEGGFQMMEMAFSGGKMKSHRVFKKLDKKIVLNALAKGIRLLFFETLTENYVLNDPEKGEYLGENGKLTYRVLQTKDGKTSLAESMKQGKRDVFATFENDINGKPEIIDIQYEHLDLAFHLKALKK